MSAPLSRETEVYHRLQEEIRLESEVRTENHYYNNHICADDICADDCHECIQLALIYRLEGHEHSHTLVRELLDQANERRIAEKQARQDTKRAEQQANCAAGRHMLILTTGMKNRCGHCGARLDPPPPPSLKTGGRHA